MKNRTRKTVIRSGSVALVAMMVAGVALIDNSTGLSVFSAEASSSGLTNVSDKYSTANFRADYFNEYAVAADSALSNEERWVIVDLGGPTLADAFEETNANAFPEYANSTAAYNLQAQIERSHTAFLQNLSARGISYEFKYSYSTLLSGVAIKVKNGDIAAVRAMNEVKEVYSSESYAVPETATAAPTNDAYVYTTGIYDSSAAAEMGYRGEGMVVAVLDTGLDYTHPAFQNMPASPSMKLEGTALHNGDSAVAVAKLEAASRLNTTSANSFYINSKVPFAYDYADDDTDVYPAYSTHGTHVAGIIAGKDDSKIVKAGENGDPDETFVGVAPEAQLVICKVFTDDLDNRSVGSANAIDILAALADCVTLGVDVINMSLGTSAGFSEEGFASAGILEDVYDRIEEQGISLVTAASNDYSSGYGGAYGTNLASNPDSGTVGSPSTYESALSVASISGKKSNYAVVNSDSDKVAFMTESADANGHAYSFLDMLYEKLGKDKSETIEVNYVVIGGVGNAANYNTLAVRKALAEGPCIAVVKRGDISFAEKIENAMNADMVGVIVYNNVSGAIRMSLGEVNNPIAACSVSMDAGKLLVDSATSSRGTLTFSYDQAAGPFMSDFSSWGPTPDLKLKPEITAHGGEITSSVPGGYETLSGTSMATPNMAGAVALLRQYLNDKQGLTGQALNNRVNQLLMSTATMAYNEEGNPYSPRKQGAGLANIEKALHTQAYLTVEGKDKPKLELYDDPQKTGVYDMTFTINNTSGDALAYRPSVYVMTESLSSDLKTVAEKAYMLNEDSRIEVNGELLTDSTVITVPANGSVKVNVKITLNDAAKKYLNETFENGMYVEGFIRLDSADGSGVELGIPYLAFYGDWTSAPMFDYNFFEVETSAADQSVEEEDKIKASSNSSKLLGFYDDRQYIVTMGSYLFPMAANYTAILPSQDRAAISCYDYEGRRTVYQIYSFYAGMLRSAKTMDIVVYDEATGEVVYRVTEDNVRKSYSAGGSNIGSVISLEIDPLTWNLSNNKTYVISLDGTLDYQLEDGRESTTQRHTETMKFTVDTEAPLILDTRIRFEPYTENEVTKYRIYVDADVYDNQYAACLFPCYLKEEDGEQELALLTQYPIPIYSSKGGITTVTYDVTDCYEDVVLSGNFYLSVVDYAMNESAYHVEFDQSLEFPTAITLQTDDKLSLSPSYEAYPVYNLTLEQYEEYTVEIASGLASDVGAPALTYACEGDVISKDNKLFSSASNGSGTVTIQTNSGTTLAVIHVTVKAGGRSKPIIQTVSVESIFDGENYYVPITPNCTVSLKPNQTRQLIPSVEPWYTASLYGGVQFSFASDNPYVLTVDEDGTVKTLISGYAYVTVSTNTSAAPMRFRINVDEELDITDYRLMHYYGGAYCEIPDSKNVTAIDEEAFKNNLLVEEIVLPISVTSLPENCFLGCINLKKITIPAECVVINKNAFKGCTSLETIVLVQSTDKITGEKYPGTLTVGKNVFEGCTNLKYIINEDGEPMATRITTAYDYAFAGCTSLETINISGLRTGGAHLFEGCTSLTSVTMGPTTQVGKYMFNGCVNLNNITYYANAVPDYAFNGCSSLDSFEFDGSVNEIFGIGAYAFAGTNLSSFTLPNGTYNVGAHAFGGCESLTTVTLSAQTNPSFGAAAFSGSGFNSFNSWSSDYFTVSGGMLLSKDGTVLLYAPYARDTFTVPSGVIEIGAYAFAESAITAIDFMNSDVEIISEGAFQGCASLTSVTLGAKLKEIGAYAFAECGALKQIMDVQDAAVIGDYAFYKTPISGIIGEEVTVIGAHAFDGTDLYTFISPSRPNAAPVSLLKVTTIGDFAFANIGSGFHTIYLGPVTEMGEHVFADCKSLETVTFAEGATQIGSFAFVSADVTLASILLNGVSATNANTALKNVSIPGSMKSIGDFAFLYATNLTSDGMKFGGVETVGMGAFWFCSQIKSLDLSGLVTIGDYAFESTGLATVNLQNAARIGSYAFAEAPVTSLTMPKAEVIGENAFAATRLTEVRIPSSLTMTYEDFWSKVDDFNVSTERRGRYFYSYGGGAFGYITTLQTITVDPQNNDYFVDEYGVLYGVISGTKENGTYVLLQYPAGNTHNPDASYNVIQNTVRIGDYAFYNVTRLSGVHFPYTVKEIGSAAFYYSSVKTFEFESVEAPVLEAAYSLPPAADAYAVAAQFGLYYNNFYNYAVYLLFGDSNYGLTIVYPENGIGYDNLIWQNYFGTVNLSAYAMEDSTREAEAYIASLPTLQDLKDALAKLSSDAEKLAYIKSVGEELIQLARKQYNELSSDAQRALIPDSFMKLVSLETLVRETRAELGDPAQIVSLKVVTPVKRTYYVGESFDPSDLVLAAVYDDTSEVLLTVNDLTLVSGKTSGAFTLADDDCTIVYSYGGIEYTVYITVLPRPDGDPGDDNVALIVGICVGCAVVAAGGAVAAVLALRSRKKKTAEEKNAAENDTEDKEAEDNDNHSSEG